DCLPRHNRALSTVKPYQLFTRINRSNARHMIESLSSWLRLTGEAGLVILVDISRLAVARNPKDERVFYTKAAVLDAYEILREFIDSTDRLESCFLVVVPDPTFLDDDALGRGI